MQTNNEQKTTKATPTMPQWENCPQCHQSATGVYNGKLACRRDGWVKGQDPDGGLFA